MGAIDQGRAAPIADAPRRSLLGSLRKQWTWYLFIAPNVLLFGTFTIFTWAFLLYLSVHDWSLIGARTFVGLDNYSRALGDEVFWIALRNTAEYSLLVVFPMAALSLLLAVLVNQPMRFMGVFRSAFYLPVVTSISVIAIIWACLPAARAGRPR